MYVAYFYCLKSQTLFLQGSIQTDASLWTFRHLIPAHTENLISLPENMTVM